MSRDTSCDNIQICNPVFSDTFTSNSYHNVGHIMIGGDFNTDLSRTESVHGISLNRMRAREPGNVHKTLSDFVVDYKYESESNFIRSFIDPYVTSENNICDGVESDSVLHDGDHLSGHFIVCHKVVVSVAPNTVDINTIVISLWHKLTTYVLRSS